MKINKDLVLFTSEFPCGSGEPFLQNEFEVLRKKFDRVFIIPLNFKENFLFNLSEPEKVVNFKLFKLNYSNYYLLLRHLGLMLKITLGEFIFSNNKKIFLKHLREFNSQFLESLGRSKALYKFINSNDLNNAIFYSFWMNEWAMALAILKKQSKIDKFFFRANGFDVYEDQTKYNYIPYRNFIYKNAHKMFGVSKAAAIHMRSFGVNENKIEYAYFGTKDLGLSKFIAEEKYTILTCSDLRSIKRVHLMIDILKYIDFPIRWIHHGSKGDAEQIFYGKLKELPKNVEFQIFERKESHAELLNFIKDNHFNLFVLLSETEGLPVILIEVTSFGIPVLATNVGGVSEIISDKNGLLIPKNFDSQEVANILKDLVSGVKNTIDFRQQVRQSWESNFKMEVNYENFYNQLVN